MTLTLRYSNTCYSHPLMETEEIGFSQMDWKQIGQKQIKNLHNKLFENIIFIILLLLNLTHLREIIFKIIHLKFLIHFLIFPIYF